MSDQMCTSASHKQFEAETFSKGSAKARSLQVWQDSVQMTWSIDQKADSALCVRQ